MHQRRRAASSLTPSHFIEVEMDPAPASLCRHSEAQTLGFDWDRQNRQRRRVELTEEDDQGTSERLWQPKPHPRAKDPRESGGTHAGRGGLTTRGNWLGRRDSNPNNLLQRQVSYR